MAQETLTEIEKLEVGPPLRLVGMTWVPMLIIYFLPSTAWAIVPEIFLGLFIISSIRAAFQPLWERYETMGAFVTMQAVWFAGLLWIPESLSFLQYIFIFLIISGIAMKFKQIEHINKGMRIDLKWSDQINKRKTQANLYVLKNGHGSFELAEKFSSFDENQKELLKFATKSIKEIDPIGGIPMGFTLEFVAAYPDVLLWWNGLSDEKQDNLLKDFDENNFLDKNQKIKSKYLRVIIEAYKNTGAKLECS